MYLCIDNGNSRIKCAVYDRQGNIHASHIFENDVISNIKVLLKEHSVTDVIISSTGNTVIEKSNFDISGKWIELSHDTSLPIQIIYSTPSTLGRDRIAAACGAHALYHSQNCLVVDSGTCMTVDLLLSTGIYLGGNIAPGLHMRLKAMHEQTARLPLVEPGWPELVFGDSTLHALQNGACQGMILEIEGYLNHARRAYGDVSIVITGGDSAFLAGKLESRIFVEPELVTHGLFQILSFNVQNTR